MTFLLIAFLGSAARAILVHAIDDDPSAAG
jgi:hypothetical protein